MSGAEGLSDEAKRRVAGDIVSFLLSSACSHGDAEAAETVHRFHELVLQRLLPLGYDELNYASDSQWLGESIRNATDSASVAALRETVALCARRLCVCLDADYTTLEDGSLSEQLAEAVAARSEEDMRAALASAPFGRASGVTWGLYGLARVAAQWLPLWFEIPEGADAGAAAVAATSRRLRALTKADDAYRRRRRRGLDARTCVLREPARHRAEPDS